MEKAGKKLAKSLLEIRAVMLRPDEPFTFASGWLSPIYCDNRKILSFPELRSQVGDWLADIVREKYPDCEVIAGVATGAIAHGLMVAERLKKPFVYVRPKPKDHGTGSQIEGILESGKKVVVIEDLISTGVSSLAAVAALREAGADIMGMAAIFTYGFDLAVERFNGENVELTTITNYETMISAAVETGYVDPGQIDVLRKWRESPSSWGV